MRENTPVPVPGDLLVSKPAASMDHEVSIMP
jgi:hypothetical protein